MINEKKVAEKVYDFSSNVSVNPSGASYSNKFLYKYGRLCVFSIIATFTGITTERHMATVPDACKPLSRINLSCDRYNESLGAEAYIASDGKIRVSNAQTGDFKISGTWITI